MIEMLKGITSINGKKVCDLQAAKNVESLKTDGHFDWDKFDEFRKDFPISIDHANDMISFKMLTKPASEGGNLELCQLTELIETARIMLNYLNDKYPCAENKFTLNNLDAAIGWQKMRTKDRSERGVEGKNEN